MKRSWPPFVGFFLLSALLAGSLWIVPYLPTNDGPEWVFASHIENHYGDADAPYPLQYVPALQFAARGFTVLYDPFEDWLGWQRGLQVTLTLTVLLVSWGFVALVHAVDPRRWALGFLGFPLALSWEFYMGFWAFVVASGLGLLLLSVAVRLREPTLRTRALLSLLLLVQAIAHVFTAVLTGGALLALALARAPRGRRLGELARMAVVGLPAAGILAASVLVGGRAMSTQHFGRLPWRYVLVTLPQTAAPGPLGRALLVTGGITVAAAIALARARRPETDPCDRGLGIAAALLLIAAVLAPRDIAGWQFFSERFLPLGTALAVVSVPIDRAWFPVRRLVPPALFVAAAAWIAFSYPFHRRLSALCADAFQGLSAPIHRSLEQLPVLLANAEDPSFEAWRAEVPMQMPLLHMGALYAVAHGGLIPFVFSSSPATYPFTDRKETILQQPGPDLESWGFAVDSGRLERDRRFRYEVEDEETVFGTHYEGIVLLGARPDDVALWRGRGYVIDWEHGSAVMAHFVPCGVDFTAPAIAVDPPPLFDVTVGDHDLLVNKRSPSTIGDDGLAHFNLAQTPCGDIAVRAHWGSAFCSNADERGRLNAVISRTSHRVTCTGVATPPGHVAEPDGK